MFWKFSLVEFKTVDIVEKPRNPECFRENETCILYPVCFFSQSCSYNRCEQICGNFLVSVKMVLCIRRAIFKSKNISLATILVKVKFCLLSLSSSAATGLLLSWNWKGWCKTSETFYLLHWTKWKLLVVDEGEFLLPTYSTTVKDHRTWSCLLGEK
jgi:hypothetical protein